MLSQDWNKYASSCKTFILFPEDEIIVSIYSEYVAKNTCFKNEMHCILSRYKRYSYICLLDGVEHITQYSIRIHNAISQNTCANF